MSLSPSQQRRNEEKERRREQIVDAAERVFERHGFDGATMDQVARKARVSRALVYVYFRDRTALQAAVCIRALKLLRERFLAVIENQPDGLSQIYAIGRAYLRFAGEEPVYFQALSHFESCTPPADEPESPIAGIIEHGRLVHGVTVAALQAGMRDGSLRPDIDDPLLMSITLWGFTHGVVQIARTKGEAIAAYGIDVERFIDHALELTGRALARDPANAAPKQDKG